MLPGTRYDNFVHACISSISYSWMMSRDRKQDGAGVAPDERFAFVTTVCNSLDYQSDAGELQIDRAERLATSLQSVTPIKKTGHFRDGVFS